MKLALLILLTLFVAVHLAGWLVGRQEALPALSEASPPCPPPDKERRPRPE